MKSRTLNFLSALVAVVAIVALFPIPIPGRAQSAGESSRAGWEYATIRWAGRDNTHIIRPGGKVEFIGVELKRLPRPDRADERSFYMNVALNGLVKEGWEFAGMTADDIVMRRPLSP